MANRGVRSSWWRKHSPTIGSRVTGLGLFAVLGVVVLGGAAGGPEWLVAWHATAAVLVFTGLLIGGRYLFGRTTDPDRTSSLAHYRVGVQFVLLAVLLGVTYQSRTPGFGLGFHRPAEAAVVLLALVTFCVLARDPRRYDAGQWLVIGCVATVVGIFFYHSVSIAEVSFRSRHPVWAGFIMAVGIVVLPQYLSRGEFLWTVARFAAVLVLLALPVYAIGEYTLLGLSVTFHGSYTIPLLDYEVRATRSLFVNRNAFAVVVFAGLVAAVSEVHRVHARDRPTWTLAIPLAVLAVNGVGLAMAYGRALWIITPMSLGVYGAYLAFGRRAVPYAVLAAFAYLVSGIVAVHSGVVPLPEDTPTRATRWYPAAAAIADQPSLLGEGLVDPGQIIGDYHPQGSTGSPHNSYLTMGIRAGILGGLSYVILILAGLVRGALWDRDDDVAAGVAVLSLAVGFVAHQQFEAYTLFNWTSSTVLAVLVVGSLVFGGANRAAWSSAGEEPDRAPARTAPGSRE